VLRDGSRAYALLLVTIAVYLLLIRTWGVSTSFLMLRDQIRDWRFALGPLTGLPLTGTQSTAGGSSLGPIYYWVLWLIRHLVGPWTGYLPHAGAIGLAIGHTAADLFFLHAIRRRTGSLWLAIGVTLFTATTSHLLAISSTIWNPTVSVAFSEVTLALLLLDAPTRAAWRVAVTAASVWFAVQAHSAALFIAVPALAYFVLRSLAAGEIVQSLQRIRTIGEVILVLQLPFIYHMFTNASESGPARALGSATRALTDPTALRLGPSSEALLRSLSRIFFDPWPSAWWIAPLLAAAAILIVVARRDLALLCATLFPLVCTALGFALWQGNYDEYWYLPVAPCAALMVGLACAAWRPKAGAAALVGAVLLMQPGRIAHSHTRYRMPEYRALSRGAREILRQTPVIRHLSTSFPMPALSDAAFPYEAMGGRLSPDAAFDATIDADGQVRFTPAR
jgi:hypothetical protein